MKSTKIVVLFTMDLGLFQCALTIGQHGVAVYGIIRYKDGWWQFALQRAGLLDTWLRGSQEYHIRFGQTLQHYSKTYAPP